MKINHHQSANQLMYFKMNNYKIFKSIKNVGHYFQLNITLDIIDFIPPTFIQVIFLYRCHTHPCRPLRFNKTNLAVNILTFQRGSQSFSIIHVPPYLGHVVFQAVLSKCDVKVCKLHSSCCHSSQTSYIVQIVCGWALRRTSPFCC